MLIQEITSAKAPKAIGPYTPAVKLGDFVYMSGQIPGGSGQRRNRRRRHPGTDSPGIKEH